jgi:hypothetical protein
MIALIYILTDDGEVVRRAPPREFRAAVCLFFKAMPQPNIHIQRQSNGLGWLACRGLRF